MNGPIFFGKIEGAGRSYSQYPQCSRMSSSMKSSSSQAKPKRPTLYIKARSQLRADIPTNAKVRYVYKVSAEAPIDIAWAFSALHEAGWSYRMRDDPNGILCFQTGCDIGELRELWDEKKKDLHVMIESLDYANEYTGDRYFTKYWDNKEEPEAYYSEDE